MTAPVDVLARIRESAAWSQQVADRGGIPQRVRESASGVAYQLGLTGAAVAELIEAGSDPDLFRRPDSRDAETKARIYAAKRRFRAAIARVGGGQ